MTALDPLKQRYNQQHYNLRKFYYECSNLKYLTSLINVPKLGQVRILVYFNSPSESDIFTVICRNLQI